MQFSGLHMHADANGQDAGLHLTHLHSAAPEVHSHHGNPDGNDHGAEIDVSLAEQLSTSWTKLTPLLIVFVAAVLFHLRSHTRLKSSPTHSGNGRRRERWRPPLRAPPISL
jgi:hypothetical protein